MCLALNVPYNLTVDVTSRINGFDGKIALIKRGAERYLRLPRDSMALMNNSLSAIEEYKRYRDGVMHAWMTEPNATVADTAQRRGIVDEVLISRIVGGGGGGGGERLQWLEQESGDIF